ncbi:ribosome-recycling factor, chloroplastic [Physcomitrium patens]|uniref:Ribosome-recycling factor, chloroplastic n=1 Tax=Physcomitrium patens TaxID=3218 RepID=A9T8Y4_PHYPA|nr:ribosome-recycling factor, chloroplastic-like [Physcomitrium patens]PNR34920.1 hypothetical protein PHYPA_022819 [Physcomitrium patens]|eukprot:XP_024401790.1 ribosome-recycling factor, chloroplastic-like [Physcomitrella patens]
MSVCATASVGSCMAKVKEAMSPLQYMGKTKAVGGGVVLPQQLSFASVALRKCRVSSIKILGRPTRSPVIRGATTEDVEAEKELIEMDAMERMEKSLEATKASFNTVRTGRATPSLLDRVQVEYYGTNVILKSIAQITTPDGSTILITPFDKSSLTSIEKSLVKSDIGITPNNDGNVIRLNVPQLTADRRKELLKLVSKLSEEGKVAIRNVRRDAIKSYEKLEKEKKLSEDNVKDLSGDIQKMTDDYIKKIDALFKQKEKELQTV